MRGRCRETADAGGAPPTLQGPPFCTGFRCAVATSGFSGETERALFGVALLWETDITYEMRKGSTMDDAKGIPTMTGEVAKATPTPPDDGIERVRRLVGAADGCELAAAAFRFPEDGALAEALVDGRFADDARSALADAGASVEAQRESDELLAPFRGDDVAAVQRDLRRGYSLLFLAPGAEVPVWPYEAPFLYRAKGRPGTPSLFRSPTTLAVAAAMAEVGFQTVDASEPSDSVAGELSFLSALLGSAAVALQAQDEATARAMVDRARRFWDEHAARWLPSFMGQAQREASSREGTARWRLLAQWGSLVLAALSESDAVFGGARV